MGNNSAYRSNDLPMRDQTYDTYGDPNHERFDEYIDRNVANRGTLNYFTTLFKNNKLIMMLVIFCSFTLGALLIGLPVGLLTPPCETSGIHQTLFLDTINRYYYIVF